MKDVFPMKVITHTITHQAKSAGGQIESITHQAKSAGGYSHSIMYPAKFAGGRSRLDLLLPSFLPSREEKKIQERRKQSIDSGAEWHNPHTDRVRTETKIQDRIFCPLRGHAVGRMQYAPTTCRQETLFPINSREERTETKMQEQKNHPSGSRGVLHTPHTDRVRIEQKKQDRIFCPLRGHAVGRMQYAPTFCRQETLFPINSQEERTKTKMQERRNQSIDSGAEWHIPHMDRVRIETKKQEQKNHPSDSGTEWHNPHTDRVRTETKMQERRKQSIDSGAEWHRPFMHQGERDAVWRDTFLEQRARVAVWRDRRLEERSSHARLQLRISGENSNPYKYSLVALSEQLRDIFAA